MKIGPLPDTAAPKACRQVPVEATFRLGLVVLVCLFNGRNVESADICARTVQVKEAMVAAAGGVNCAEFATRDLREITTLDLSDQGIAALRAGDFDGLVRLESLDLSGNLLTSLPEGIFDELYLLKALYLDGNELAALRDDVFEQLFLLEELTLDDNQLTSLPAGLFDEFSRFDGMQDSGDPPDNSGDYPRIQRFLDRHSVTSPEEFIASLPALYRQRFTFMYKSQAAAKDHVSTDHPRFISWGADASFIFAWNTDPDAPSKFRDAVEFLRQDDTAWTAGIIDFSGADAEIEEPTSCQSCHGDLNKPLWSIYSEWEGSEYDYTVDRESYMEAVLEMTSERIEPLEFPDAGFFGGNKSVRFLVSPHGERVVAAVEEAGAVWTWRHAEVLLANLRAQQSDVRAWAEESLCTNWNVHQSFEQKDHNLAVSAELNIVTEGGIISSGLLSHIHGPILYDELRVSYVYHDYGFMRDAVKFLLIAKVWQAEPVVRRLYRKTPNEDTVASRRRNDEHLAMLHYAKGTATAEDELIQKLRLHFGRGGTAALDTRARQNDRYDPGGVMSAAFGDGHVGPMRSLVCEALEDSAPGSLTISGTDEDPVLSWDAPSYDAASLTGYRILRGVGGAGPAVRVEDTGSTATTWTDDSAPAGDVAYIVHALYDGYYASPASDTVEATVARTTPELTGSATFTVVEGETAVATLTAVDSDTEADDLTWSLTGGTDQSSFTLTSAGVLTFAAAKDFETPDDGDSDGTYEVSVTVSDGANSSSADLTVTLSNANEAPTADAGADQEDIDEGATVTLSGAGSDPDASDTLTYAWTQTGTPAVALDTPAAATTTFTAPEGLSDDATLQFTLRVTDADGLFAEDNISVTVTAGEPDRVVWSTSLTIGVAAGFRGYSRIANPDLGSVSDHTFDYGSTSGAQNYAQLVVAYSGGVVFRVRGGAEHMSGLVLEWAEETLPLNAAARDGDEFTWSQTWLSANAPSLNASSHAATLPANGTGVVCLRTSGATCPATTITSSPLTASVQGPPASHDGVNAFTFELRFSEEVDLGYVALRDHSFAITDGAVRRASRLTSGSNIGWRIEVEPDSDADVVLVLEANRACSATGAICTVDGKQLSSRVELTVPGPAATALTASVSGVPASHDGSSHFSFELRFSEEVDLGYADLRDHAFAITDGAVRRASRLTSGSNIGWRIEVEPDSDADVVLVLEANRACNTDGAICTAGGEQLSNRVEVTVPGPE